MSEPGETHYGERKDEITDHYFELIHPHLEDLLSGSVDLISVAAPQYLTVD